MLLYLDHAWEKYRAEGRMSSMSDLYGAAKEGAVQRIRHKIMTICAILFGLLPIMWSPTWQAGADVTKRIAAPMIGGIITGARAAPLSGHLRHLAETHSAEGGP
jgi:Cu(I)/Ag(I) efflux system membrane protein CusA/SilA